MHRLVLVATLAVSSWACSGGPVGPTTSATPAPAPIAAPAPAPQPTYTLSGLVFEVTPTGVTPVAGVQVEEYDRHQFARTGADGFYRIAGVSAGRLAVGFDKEGYESLRSTVIIDGDTRFDIQAVRR